MFESISLEIMAFMGGSDIKVWVEDGELHYSKEAMGGSAGNTKDSVSTMTVDEFSKKLDAIGITKWKKSYEPEGLLVMDGVSWTVVYEDADYKKHKSSGDNEFPPNWKKFLKLLKETVGDFGTFGS